MRTVIFEGNTLAVLRQLPDDVRRRCGYEINRVQRGLEPLDWKPFPSIGQGVREIRVKLGNQCRIIYIAKFENKVHILHIFEKKTQKTRNADIEITKIRLKNVFRRFRNHGE